MAPTAKIINKRPGTLPADFGEWDPGETPSTLPDNFEGFDAGLGTRAAKPVAAPKFPVQTGIRIAGSRSSQVKPPVAAAILPIATPAVPLVQPNEVGIKRPSAVSSMSLKMKVRFVMVGSILLVAVIASFMLFRSRQNSGSPKQAVVVQPQQVEAPMKPAPGIAATSVAPKETTTTVEPDSQTESPTPRIHPEMMNNQLAAPTRLSRDIRRGEEQQAPAMSAAGMENMSANSGDTLKNVFGGKGTPQVRTENRVVKISAGVAVGLIIRKATPVYPIIAKNAHVEGTVVLTARISNTGKIEDLQVASGPQMLRQAAIDAVRNWRYKPYLLNNQPVDVATTVSVVFALTK